MAQGMTIFPSAVERTMRRHGMTAPGDRVLVALSGGPDSVALAHVLSILAPRLDIDVASAHLHHGLRGEEADRDAAFAADVARSLGWTHYAERVDVPALRRDGGLSLEEAAREARYDFLERIASRHGFQRIATGHHADDNAEQVLLSLLRGAGLRGLAGIRPVRNGRVVRPLLDMGRRDILGWLEILKVAFVTDTSNADEDLMRNRVRHRLLPLLSREFNPSVVAALHRLAGLIRDEEDWLDSLVEPLFSFCVLEKTMDRVSLCPTRLSSQPVAARRRILRHALEWVKGDLRAVSLVHVDGLLALASGTGPAELHLPGRIRARLFPDRLMLRQEDRCLREPLEIDAPPDFHHVVSGMGTISLSEAGLMLEFSGPFAVGEWCHLDGGGEMAVDPGQESAFFDMDRIGFPMVVRNPRAGDRFTPLGMTGTRKVNKFFTDRKLPPHDRRRCPILEHDDRIVWVVGHRISHHARVRPDTRRIMRVRVFVAD